MIFVSFFSFYLLNNEMFLFSLQKPEEQRTQSIDTTCLSAQRHQRRNWFLRPWNFIPKQNILLLPLGGWVVLLFISYVTHHIFRSILIECWKIDKCEWFVYNLCKAFQIRRLSVCDYFNFAKNKIFTIWNVCFCFAYKFRIKLLLFRVVIVNCDEYLFVRMIKDCEKKWLLQDYL